MTNKYIAAITIISTALVIGVVMFLKVSGLFMIRWMKKDNHLIKNILK